CAQFNDFYSYSSYQDRYQHFAARATVFGPCVREGLIPVATSEDISTLFRLPVTGQDPPQHLTRYIQKEVQPLFRYFGDSLATPLAKELALLSLTVPSKSIEDARRKYQKVLSLAALESFRRAQVRYADSPTEDHMDSARKAWKALVAGMDSDLRTAIFGASA